MIVLYVAPVHFRELPFEHAYKGAILKQLHAQYHDSIEIEFASTGKAEVTPDLIVGIIRRYEAVDRVIVSSLELAQHVHLQLAKDERQRTRVVYLHMDLLAGTCEIRNFMEKADHT